jgi:hypothetical protein
VKPIPKNVLVGTAAVGILLLIGIATVTYILSGMCGNHPLAEFVSPDGGAKVVVFERDCDATTGFSTQASLVKPDDQLPANSGNLFIADTGHGIAPSDSGSGPDLRVRWVNAKRVMLQHHVKARIFKAERNIEGIEVRYETFP